MAIQAILHIMNAEPVLCELEDYPAVNDTMIKAINPRQRDGKDLHFLEVDVDTVYFPIDKLNFIEILPTEEEEVIGFVRE